MNIHRNIGSPARLLTLFILLTAIPLATMVWLGWRSFQQDRALEGQHLRGSLDNAASLLVRELDRMRDKGRTRQFRNCGIQSAPPVFRSSVRPSST